MKLSPLGLCAVALAASLVSSHGATLSTTTADAAVLGNNGNPVDGGTGVAGLTITTARAGSNGTTAPIGRAYVIPFQLPTLAAGQTFSAASLTVFYAANGGAGGVVGNYPDGTVSNFNTDFYGLINHVSNAPTVAAADYFQGATDNTNATLLQNNFLVPGTQPADATALTTTGAALAGFMNSQYSLNGAGSYIFLRLNADADSGATGNFAYNFFTFDQNTVTVNGAAQSVVPFINYSVVPEPATWAAMLVGFGALCGLQRFRRLAA